MTVAWDESNPGDIICVVGANGKSQAIHGRSVAETLTWIPKVMISEFGFSQPEADEFAKMAAAQRGKPSDLEKAQADLTAAQATIRSLNTRSQKLEGLLQDAEKERDDAKAALRAEFVRKAAPSPPAPPPAPPAQPQDTGDGKIQRPASA